MPVTRRSLLATVAPGAVLTLTGCASIVTPVPGNISAAVLAYIQQVVQAAAQYLPAAVSIATLAASLFGPGWAGIVQIGSAAIQQLISALISAAHPAHRILTGRLHMLRSGEVLIGVVRHVPIYGTR